MQVVHDASHAVQTLVDELLYCPSGQTKTHIFFEASKAKLPEQERHSFLDGPEHVLQAESHPKHYGVDRSREGKRAGSQVETHDLVVD